ncbi:glycosyltransferase [Devosia pacifica]|uniref:glycosyltransferase n=1 Tax=Devosia pacifica TaxID=1335967 RepID=UPI00167B6846|nr:glycosyltransferase [Devosia pacifica]
MKVLHVFKTYLPDSFTGIERVIWQLAQGSAAHGVSSGVFFLSREPKAGRYAVGDHWAEAARQDLYVASTGISLSAFSHFSRLAREADLVHYHYPWPLMDLLHHAARHGKPSVATYHSDIVKQKRLRHFYAPLMHSFLERMDAIVATSPNYVHSSPVLARYRDKTSVIPIGLDGAGAPPDPATLDSWRQRLGDRFFLFVGAPRYYKGIEFLLRAAKTTGLPVAIAGQGELDPDLKALAGTNVHLLGRVSDDDKAALLALSQAFVFPSQLRSEAFGVALLEAAFAGKPMISCELGTGTSYINIDGQTGIVIPPADADALGTAMQRLDGDVEMRSRFGAAARARAEDLFRAETMIDDYVSLYRRVIEERR